MIGMKLGPESKCFVRLNSKKGNMINPLQRRGDKPCSSKTQLKETVLKKPQPMMLTKFQVHGKPNYSDFCSCARAKWRNSRLNINWSKLKSNPNLEYIYRAQTRGNNYLHMRRWQWRKFTNQLSLNLSQNVQTFISIGSWSILQLEMCNLIFSCSS